MFDDFAHRIQKTKVQQFYHVELQVLSCVKHNSVFTVKLL